VLRKVLLTGVGLVLIGLSRLAFNAVARHGFGAETAGAANIALSLAILVALPVSTALSAPAVRFVAAARGEAALGRAGALGRGLALAAVLGGLATALIPAPFAEVLGGGRGLSAPLTLAALGVGGIYAVYQVLRALLYAFDRVDAYGALELVAALVFGLALAGLALSGHGEALVLAFGAAWLAFVLGAGWALREPLGVPAPADERRPLRPILVFAFYGLLGSTCSLGSRELAVLYAPAHGGLEGAALIGLAVSIVTPLAFVPRVLRTVLFAETAALDGRGDRAGLARALSEASHWLLILDVPLCAGVAILAAPLLVAFGAEPSAEAVLVLRLLVLVAGAEILATPATNALPGIGRIALTAWSAVLGLGVAVAIWALPGGGVVLLALGLVASALVKGGLPTVVAMRSLGLVPTRSPGRLALLVLGGLAGVAVADLASPWVGAVLYAGFGLAAGWPELVELLRIVRRRSA
jgi:O-antigen/teichoic acid export membrane protein